MSVTGDKQKTVTIQKKKKKKPRSDYSDIFTCMIIVVFILAPNAEICLCQFNTCPSVVFIYNLCPLSDFEQRYQVCVCFGLNKHDR